MRLAWFLLWVCALAHADGKRFQLVDVEVNGMAQPATVIWMTAEGTFLVRRADALRWQLNAAGAEGEMLNNAEYIRLNKLAGIAAKLEGAKLAITAEGAAFPRVSVDMQRATGEVEWQSGKGAYLNYDASLLLARGVRPIKGATVEGVAYADTLSFTTTGVGTLDEQGKRFIRYESFLRKDFPESAKSLVLGDTVSRGGTLANSFRFGGVSFGIDYATRPDLVTFALPVVSGESRVPTAGDLLVNGQRRGGVELPAGPFQIANVPALNGAGEIQLLTRDALGRQQVTAMPFYVSTALLKPGLVDAGFEAGKVRENFGIENAVYGRGFARGAMRAGVNDAVTVEGYAESTANLHGAGIGVTSLLGGLALGHLSIARSEGEARGTSVFGFVERTSSTVSARVSAERATEDFERLGGVRGLKSRVQGSVSAALGSFGAASMVYAADQTYDGEPARALAATFQNRVYKNVSMLVTHSITRRGGETNRATTLLLSVPLGTRSSMLMSSMEGQGGRDNVIDFNQSPPSDEGWAARGRLTQGGRSRLDAGFTYQGAQGQWLAEIGKAAHESTMRLGANGSLVWAGGGFRAVRQLGDAFAIVEIPGVGGIDVYRDNQRIATTNAGGYAIIPRLRAFEPNPIAVDTLQLALTKEIRNPRRNIVPARRAGVTVRFDAEDTRGAMLRLVLDDGSPVPAGATVKLRGKAYPVASRGDAYVTGIAAGGEVVVEWAGSRCTTQVPPAKSHAQDLMPRIGPLICRGQR